MREITCGFLNISCTYSSLRFVFAWASANVLISTSLMLPSAGRGKRKKRKKKSKIFDDECNRSESGHVCQHRWHLRLVKVSHRRETKERNHVVSTNRIVLCWSQKHWKFTKKIWERGNRACKTIYETHERMK